MQVNTDPMISVTGHLDVVVPPSIVDEESSPSEVKKLFLNINFVLIILTLILYCTFSNIVNLIINVQLL